jgi:ATP adenylyltransferase
MGDNNTLTTNLSGQQLWQQVEAMTESALACGALKSIPTHSEIREVSYATSTHDKSTVNFQIRVVENLARKLKVAQPAPNTKGLDTKRPKPFNPFLPYEPALYVGELSDHYRCLLNKFNVVDHHILMVTSKFVPQQTPLDVEDFLAVQTCLQAQDGLVFYNGGPTAGASVEHKHLQMIPLPLSDESTFPFDELLSSTIVSDQPCSTALPFPHRFIATTFNDTTIAKSLREAADINCKNYHRLLTDLKLSVGHDGTMAPHNMLMTRKHLWVVPRTKESYQGLAINALGFAGELLVKDKAQLRKLESIGCMELLKAVTQ